MCNSHGLTDTSLIQRDLTIIAWNADRLQPRVEELREFLARGKDDVLLNTETWLRAQDVVRSVSYTHLDVYKRQVSLCEIFCNASKI